MAYGLPGGLTDALLSAWAVAAYVGCMELLTWMRQNEVQPKRASTSREAASAGASVPVADAPHDDLRDRRERKARQPVHELMRVAEAVFADRTAVPSLRDIQREMSIGQGKSQTVQAHLRSLQAATG